MMTSSGCYLCVHAETKYQTTKKPVDFISRHIILIHTLCWGYSAGFFPVGRTYLETVLVIHMGGSITGADTAGNLCTWH